MTGTGARSIGETLMFTLCPFISGTHMKRSMGAMSLVYPNPVFLIGTYDERGEPNLMTAAWAGICSSKPPAIGVSLRAATYSHGNIVARKAFTVNVPSEDLVAEADYVGMRSGRDENKFAATGLTPVRSELVDAPFVKECPMVLECRLINTVEVGLHTHFIGEIVDVKADEETFDHDGVCQISKVRPFVFAPGDRGYYRIGGRIAGAFEKNHVKLKKN
ncbi:MAG: flavin reductase family protein [Methanomassiliicoccales archaeon]|nr:flavin reductase family protein [Methanomassiliicoccales archaeon]